MKQTSHSIPLAGQAVIDHLMPDKFSVQAYPGADRIARGEQWVQTNTLDGQHPHDASSASVSRATSRSSDRPDFTWPSVLPIRRSSKRATPMFAMVSAARYRRPCTNTIDGQVNVERLSRTPDQRLYPSGSHDQLAWTQCWVSLGDPMVRTSTSPSATPMETSSSTMFPVETGD